MRVVITDDICHEHDLRRVIEENDGYCPCSAVKSDDTKCMCKDFRDSLSDPNFYGPCHCGLYIKIPD